MWTLKLVISHWPQHRSLAVHIPVPEAIMSEECTRLPKKTPMKITDIMLPGNWRTKWNLLEIMYAGPSQSIALGDPMDHLPLIKQNCTRTLMSEKKSSKNRDIPASYSCVFTPKRPKDSEIWAFQCGGKFPILAIPDTSKGRAKLHGPTRSSWLFCFWLWRQLWLWLGVFRVFWWLRSWKHQRHKSWSQKIYILSDNPLQKALFWKWCKRKARFYWIGKVNIIVSDFCWQNASKHSTQSNIKVSCNRLKHQQLNNHHSWHPQIACWRIDSTADEIRISAPSALVAPLLILWRKILKVCSANGLLTSQMCRAIQDS